MDGSPLREKCNMDGSAAQRVLLLPELLALVLSFLHNDPPSLSSAARVNSAWNMHSIKLLWLRPLSRGLLHVSQDRRQLYADHIQSLSFDCEQEDRSTHAQYASLQFPKLRHISIDTYRPTDTTPWIRQYLQPALQQLEFYGGNLHEDIRPLLSELCPRLKKLLIGNIGTDIPAENLVEFLTSFRELKDITLFYNRDYIHRLPGDLFCYLAGHTSLRSLGLLTPVPTSAIRLASETISHPFHQLTKLEIEVQASALPILFSMVSNLIEIDLTVEPDIPLRVLSCISSLQDLEILRFPRQTPEDIDEDLLALRKFPRLREFRMPDTGDSPFWEMSLTCLDSIWKCMPRLEYIELQQYMEDGSDLFI